VLAGPFRVTAALGGELDEHLRGGVRVGAERPFRGHLVVDGVAENVAGTGLEQPGRVLADVRDHVGHRDHVIRGKDAERGHGLAVLLHLGGAQRDPVLAGLPGLLEQRVVNVGDVLRERRVVPGVRQHPPEQVERHRDECVAQVAGVVRGDPAHVDAHGGGAAARIAEPHQGA
jgi:hypothetical protein